MKRGWVRLHRSVWESHDFRPAPFSDREAFLWSVCEAAHCPTTRWFNGSLIALERSEFVTSIRDLAHACGWGDKRARGFMERMTKSGNWAQRRARMGAQSLHPHATVISVCLYDKYQTHAEDCEDAEGTAGGAPKGEAGAQLGHSEGTQYKKVKNLKKGKEGEEEASPSRAPARPYSEMVAMWSQAAAIKGWKPLNPQLNDERRKGLAKIHETHGLDGWRQAIQQALDSAFLGGPDPPAWFNFSFLSNPKKFLNVIEGNYSESFSGTRDQPRSSWLDANESLTGGLPDFGGAVSEAQPSLDQLGYSPQGALAR